MRGSIFPILLLLGPTLAIAKDGDYQRFVSLAVPVDNKISEEAGNELREIVGRQRPAISTDELRQLYAATRDAIRTGEYRLRETRTRDGKTTGEEFETAFTDAMVMYRMSHANLPSPLVGGGRKSAARSYDGKIVRHFETFSGRADHGGITPFTSYSSFVQADGDILAKAMLCDSELRYGMKNLHVDFEHLMKTGELTAFDEVIPVLGYDCMVLSNVGIDVFVAPSLNYALVRFVRYEINDGQRMPAFERLASKFEEVIPGLFLPKRIVEKDSHRGTLTLDVADMSFNKEIPESKFTGIIPIGTQVSDTVRGLTYIQAREGSIGAMLDNEIVPKGRFGFGLRLAILGILLGSIALLLFQLLHKKQEKASV